MWLGPGVWSKGVEEGGGWCGQRLAKGRSCQAYGKLSVNCGEYEPIRLEDQPGNGRITQ